MAGLNDYESKSAHLFLLNTSYHRKDLLTVLQNKIVEARVKVNCKRPWDRGWHWVMDQLETLKTKQYFSKVVSLWQYSNNRFSSELDLLFIDTFYISVGVEY